LGEPDAELPPLEPPELPPPEPPTLWPSAADVDGGGLGGGDGGEVGGGDGGGLGGAAGKTDGATFAKPWVSPHIKVSLTTLRARASNIKQQGGPRTSALAVRATEHSEGTTCAECPFDINVRLARKGNGLVRLAPWFEGSKDAPVQEKAATAHARSCAHKDRRVVISPTCVGMVPVSELEKRYLMCTDGQRKRKAAGRGSTRAHR
jgi:hypothetical protein